jgi:hypothetical protein
LLARGGRVFGYHHLHPNQGWSVLLLWLLRLLVSVIRFSFLLLMAWSRLGLKLHWGTKQARQSKPRHTHGHARLPLRLHDDHSRLHHLAHAHAHGHLRLRLPRSESEGSVTHALCLLLLRMLLSSRRRLLLLLLCPREHAKRPWLWPHPNELGSHSHRPAAAAAKHVLHGLRRRGQRSPDVETSGAAHHHARPHGHLLLPALLLLLLLPGRGSISSCSGGGIVCEPRR